MRLSFKSHRSLLWTHAQSPSPTLLAQLPSMYRFILHATYDYIMGWGLLCVSGFPHWFFRGTTSKPLQWLYRANNTEYSKPFTKPITWCPSHSVQQLPQKPSHISCRKTVLHILGQHAALPALLTQHCCSTEPHLPCSFPWWPSKVKFVKRLVSSLTVPWLPKDCAFLLYHSCYASTMNKHFFLIFSVEKSGQEPKGNAREN